MSSTSEYMVGPVIGQGGFSHVVYAMHKHSKRKVAIKVVEQVTLQRHPWLLQAVMNEKKILQLCSSMNTDNQSLSWIVQLWAAFYDSQQMYLVMELCTGGDLEGLLQQIFGNRNDTGKLSTVSAHMTSWYKHSVPFYASKLIQAVNFLHNEKRILHCDLKPGNCLLDCKTGHLKLADFASAIEMNVTSQNVVGLSSEPIIPRGTTEYSCPEIIHAKSPSLLTEAVDYWSMGCILFAMIDHDGKSPFAKESEALTVQAVVDYCTASNPSFDRSTTSSEHSSRNEDWLEMATQLLLPVPEERTRSWNEKIMKSKLLEDGNSEDLSQITLPRPLWKSTMDSAPLKDGSSGWSAFQTI
jgi:3-phosphoinositide dependent protein kinase-1